MLKWVETLCEYFGPLREITTHAIVGREAPRGYQSDLRAFAAGRGVAVKHCKLCRFSRVCNDLPGICILLQYTAVGVLISVLAYLFITQEMLA